MKKDHGGNEDAMVHVVCPARKEALEKEVCPDCQDDQVPKANWAMLDTMDYEDCRAMRDLQDSREALDEDGQVRLDRKVRQARKDCPDFREKAPYPEDWDCEDRQVCLDHLVSQDNQDYPD